MTQAPPISPGAHSEPSLSIVEKYYWQFFASVTAIGLLMRLACFTGLIASDDLEYSRYAQLISQLHYKPELSQFALRYGVIIPLGLVYRVFGIAEWTTIILPLLASTASVAMLMCVGRKLLGPSAALTAGLLLATFPADLRYATILVPEPVAGAWILLAVLLYLYWGTGSPAAAGFVSGLCIGAAYLSKEPALFVAPALMIDALARRQWRIFSSIAVGVLLIVGFEHIYYVAVTGDLMFRPHAMAQHNQAKYMINVNQHLVWRLFKVYPKMMILPNWTFGLHSVSAIALTISVFFLVSKERWRLPVLWAAVPWLYLNFGTSSLNRYWVLPAGDRYILFIYPPLFLLAAEVLLRIKTIRPRAAPLVRAAFVVILMSGFYCGFVLAGEGWRTDAVKELRTIAREAKLRNVHTVAMKNDSPPEWSPAMEILDHDARPSVSETPELLIGPDALGLPTVISISPP
jgi:4-amino-4-deoxy-L-arabinose transferase-like glycosyltransferase